MFHCYISIWLEHSTANIHYYLNFLLITNEKQTRRRMLRNECAHKDEAEWTCGTYMLISTWGF